MGKIDKKTGDWDKFSEDLWEELRNSCMNKSLYSAILRFLSEVDFELQQRLNLDNYKHEFVMMFKKILAMVPEILKIMDLKMVMAVLKSISGEFGEIIQSIQ